MRLDDMRESDNVDDRRGEGGGGFGPRLAMGGGGLGLVAVVVVSLLFGVDPRQFLDSGAQAPVQQTQQGTGCTDADCVFARHVIGSAEDVWKPILEQKGVRFTPATLTVYDSVTPTACGTGQSSAGPFYCPGDSNIYLDLTFYRELSGRFGAAGDFARAYVIAHEYGHHIQNLMGTMARGEASATGATGASVRTELQADCYAGVWTYRANLQSHMLETGDVEEGLKAASAVGDDTLQKESQGYVVPDSFTHGTSAQRMRWFQRGLAQGDMDSCDTSGAL
jgi:predicted metalloprotease